MSNTIHPPRVRTGTPITFERFKGNFIKRCPGTNAPYLCCGYHVLNLSLNCSLGCDYCILQAYLDSPKYTVYTNWDTVRDELYQLVQSHPKQRFRIGTGELTDSLVLDPAIGLTSFLVPLFADCPRVCLELKTKTDAIAGLQHLGHKQKTVVSWSLSPDYLIHKHERNTASLDSRLQAARTVGDWGYPLGFHLDPIIHYPDWHRDYQKLIQKLFATIDPGRITWISLGTFRYLPKLETIIRPNKRKRALLLDEFIVCPDGKYRYFWPLRVEILSEISGFIRQAAPDVFLYLCMESPKVWEKTLGWTPRNMAELSKKLDQRVFQPGNGE